MIKLEDRTDHGVICKGFNLLWYRENYDMISKVENISKEQLEKIRILVGEAFVTNELFHNWGSVEDLRI